MKKCKVLVILMSFFMVLCVHAFAFAADDDKVEEEAIDPVWVRLGERTVASDYNPDGAVVVYGMDKASAKVHRSNKDFGFWLAKITREKNEIEVTYIRMANDKSYYWEVEKQVYFLDGTLKSAEILNDKSVFNSPVSSSGPLKALTGDEVFYSAPEMKEDASVGENLAMPGLPKGFNSMLLKNSKPGYEKWLCFLDNRATGLDARDRKRLTVVTYAYNTADRVYYKGLTFCERTGENSYRTIGGDKQLYTYDGKLLKRTNERTAYFISDQQADRAARFKYRISRKQKQ